MKRIGIVGLGRMGANMARRLKETGYEVTAVYDVQRETAEKLAAELGCQASPTLAGVTAAADLIITVVTDDKAMLGIFAGKKDNLLRGAAGKVFVNCATVSPSTHVTVEKLAKKARAATLEGCMASSITQGPAPARSISCAGAIAPPSTAWHRFSPS